MVVLSMSNKYLDRTNLIQGDQYDLTLQNGNVMPGWYLNDKKCGYFTKDPHSQLAGFIYSESVASVVETNVGCDVK